MCEAPARWDSATYNIALVLHLLGVLAFVPGIVLAGAAFESAPSVTAVRDRAAAFAHPGASAAGRDRHAADRRVRAVARAAWPLELRLGLGRRLDRFFVAALALGGLGGQRPKQARRLAAELAEQRQPVSVELRALLDDRLSMAENYGSLPVIVVIVAFMVFKP